MKRYQWRLVGLVIFLFCVAVVSLPLAQEDLTKLVKRVKPSVVAILTYDKELKALGQGSGFFISKKGDLITNYHVLEGASSAEIKTADGKLYPIRKVLAEDKEADLVRVLVEISEDEAHPLLISSSIPEVGEQVLVIGNPLGLEQTVSDGIVSAVREIPTFGKIVQVTAPISPGSSGSPVINMKGEVVGVATLYMIEGQNLNFAISGEKVAGLKPGKGKALGEWAMERREEWRSSTEGLFSLGLYFVFAEEYEKALAYFEEVVKKDSLYAEAHYNLGWTYGRLGRYQEAIEAYKQAIRINPDFAAAHYNLGWTYGRLGRYQEAIEAYKQAIRINPDYAEAHCNLVLAYDSLGRNQEAIEACKQAIRIKPDFAEAHCFLGVAYYKLGRHQEAVEAYKQAIRINPDFAEAHYNLGLAYLLFENQGSALDEYKILKDLDKNLANKLFNSIYE